LYKLRLVTDCLPHNAKDGAMILM